MVTELENSGWKAKILADSITPLKSRLTTMEVTFPRIVLAEFNTHRMFSRNSASSRAIPIEKIIERVEKNPFVPFYWGKNQKGMQAYEELDPDLQRHSTNAWHRALVCAIDRARELNHYGVHKQIANRLLEPFMWHTVIVSATDWGNFFKLRCAPEAQPEIRNVALLMQELYNTHEPQEVLYGAYHLPLIFEEDWKLIGKDIAKAVKIAVARCARVSYLTHDGKRDHQADLDLYESLLKNRHLSPFEHVAVSTPRNAYYGNFKGWIQHRKQIPYEWDASLEA